MVWSLNGCSTNSIRPPAWRGGARYEPDDPRPGPDDGFPERRGEDPRRAPDAASEGFFELKVRPVLAGTCVKCHGDKKQQRRPPARFARGDAHRRRQRPGRRPGRPGRQPADPGDPSRRTTAQDAPHGATAPTPPRPTWPPGSPRARPGPRRRDPADRGPGPLGLRAAPAHHAPRRPDRLGRPEPIDRLIAAGAAGAGASPRRAGPTAGP